jgi:hypothetical protein
MIKIVEPSAPLRQVVEEAYCFFAADPPTNWVGDGIGVGERDWARLTDVPLRDLTLYDTTHFLTETPHHNGREVRYMLPRLMDMLAEGDAPTVIAVECSLSCLASAGYPDDWTESERDLIERFFHELLRSYCADPRHFAPSRAIGDNLGGYLCMIGSAGRDVAGALQVLDSVPQHQLAHALALWIGPSGNPLFSWRSSLHDGFWDLAPANREHAVLDWVEALNLPHLLETAFFEEADPEWQETISDALEHVKFRP